MKESSHNPTLWFAKADTDLRAAELALTVEPALTDVACYHAQQCAEKYLKGYLVAHGVAFRFVHELAYLVRLCMEASPTFSALLVTAAELQDYASDVRYPIEDLSEPTTEEAQEAITHAQCIRTFVRAHV